MQRLSLLGLFLIALLLNACSDDGASPNDDPNGGGDDTLFAIVSVDQDTVYWGDTVNVTLKQAHTNSFTVFVHTIPAEVETSTLGASGDASVSFLVPEGASGAGLIRIFEGDTLQAAGNHSLVVLPQSRRKLTPSIQTFIPERGYAGDLLLLNGSDIPMRLRDISVTINDVHVPIVATDSLRIYTRITPQVTSGPVVVRIFDQVFEPGTFTKLQTGGQLLPNGVLRAVKINVTRVQGAIRLLSIFNGDTVEKREEKGSLPSQNISIEFDALQTAIESDSIIYLAEQEKDGITQTLEIRLRPEPENRASGVVRIITRTVAMEDITEIRISNMRWMEDSYYTLYSHSTDLPNELIAYSRTRSQGSFLQSETYISGEETSVVTIELIP